MGDPIYVWTIQRKDEGEFPVWIGDIEIRFHDGGSSVSCGIEPGDAQFDIDELLTHVKVITDTLYMSKVHEAAMREVRQITALKESSKKSKRGYKKRDIQIPRSPKGDIPF